MTRQTAIAARLAGRSAYDDALFILAPVVTAALLVISRHSFAVDFQDQYWVVGQRLLHGSSPYTWTHTQIASGAGAFPYPALTAVLFVPFGLLSKGLAAWIWVAIQVGSVLATLRVLSVRDRRLYPLVLLWWPVIIGWTSGNITLLLVLLLAVVWRYRDRPAIAGLVVAVMISLKPYMWPVGLWLIATRRYRATTWGLATGLGLNLIAWSIVGFDQLGRYVHLDSAVADVLYRRGYGVISLIVRLGGSRGAGTAAMVVLGIALAALCLWLGRRRREAPALVVAAILTMEASPLSWMHYLAPLIVPLAVLRPRVSREWLVPLLLWLCPGGLQESTWQVLLFIATTVAVTYMLLAAEPSARDAPVAVSDQRRTGQAHVLATAQGGERAG
jgi:LPXTG-motif cell wall-anchored protein